MKAFPSGNVVDNNGLIQPFNDGMDLRDYFAAKAMQGICTLLDTAMQSEINSNQIAKDAYQIADAMMEARKVKNG